MALMVLMVLMALMALMVLMVLMALMAHRTDVERAADPTGSDTHGDL